MDFFDQAKKLITQSKNILILLPENYIRAPAHIGEAGDKFCSGKALFYTLKKLGKIANFSIKEAPSKFQFLNRGLNPFVISIDTAGKEIGEMRYEKEDNNLKIFFSLKSGEMKERDVSFSSFHGVSPADSFGQIAEKPDLLITVGAKSPEELSDFLKIFGRAFYETPVLNIDNQISNENFGAVNVVQISSPSLSEIVATLIRLIDENLIDADISTLLLAGVVSATQNFQNARTRPQTFDAASFLIEKGADHQRIIQHLFRQKSISQVRLLGRVLEKLDFDEEKQIYSAALAQKDFRELEAQPKDLGQVLEELKVSLPRFASSLLLWESHASPPAVRGIFSSVRQDLVKKILENFEGEGREEAVLFVSKEENLEAAKEKILEVLKK